jgi:hypothetical protein
MEFDYDSERCGECDGHFRHFPGCSWYRGEPVLTLAQRVQVEADVRASTSGCGTVGCEAHDGECADGWRGMEMTEDLYGYDDPAGYYNFGMG